MDIDERRIRVVDHWQHIAEVQNDWMRTTGTKVAHNNNKIWGDFLHQLSNQHWQDLLDGFQEVLDTGAVYLRPDQIEGYELTRHTLDTYWHVPRCLDTNKGKMRNKPVQWRMIMILREVWNAIGDIDERALLRGSVGGQRLTNYPTWFGHA